MSIRAGNFLIKFDEENSIFVIALDFDNFITEYVCLGSSAFASHKEFDKIEFTGDIKNILNEIKIFIIRFWYKRDKDKYYFDNANYELF